MSQIEAKIYMFSTDLHITLSNFVATHVYELFKSPSKSCNIHVQNEGGSTAILTMLKNCAFRARRLPLDTL